jgi:hypothetical protein
MITKLPLSDGFALAWEYDPAFDRKESGGEVDPDFAHAYRTAIETLDWSAMCQPGKAPTLFHFRPLTGMPLRRLLDMDAGNMAKSSLAFRMALSRIENGEGLPEVKRAVDPHYPELGPMASVELAELLDSLPVAIGAPFGHLINSLGGVAFNRSLNISPRP